MNLRNPSILVQGQVVMEVRDLLWKRKDQTPSRTQTCEEGHVKAEAETRGWQPPRAEELQGLPKPQKLEEAGRALS